MNKVKTYIYVFIAILISLGIVVVTHIYNSSEKYPNEVYKVYIDGKFLGAIKSKKALEKYIDNEQKNLKEEYGVKKVYIPNGIDIEKSITYDGKILSEKEVYKKIKEKKNFTIRGYKVTISKGQDTTISNDTEIAEKANSGEIPTEEEQKSDNSDEEEKIVIYLTKKDIFDKAVKNFMYLFISEDEVNKYVNDEQPQIKSTGSIIENIYLDQDVSIKESLISTDETIYTTEEELTKFFSFNENASEKEYIIEPGDTIDSAAFKNEISTRVFLIVNPEFTNANNLLKPGQKVNVARMDPVLNLAVEKHIVEDVSSGYKTIEKEDSTMDYGTQVVETAGVNGISRQTEKVRYINGKVDKVYITSTETIKEPIDEVIVKGTKRTSSYSGSWAPAIFSGSWGWPSVSSFITTYYGYDDWHGGFHNGLDIALSGCGSPVFAIESGTVLETNSGCADISSGPGDYCGSGYGNYVWIAHPENVYAIYAHMLSSVTVSPGESVTKGQVIGFMGSSGSSSACHLHFSTFYGGTQYGDYGGGTGFDPLTLYR